MAMSAAAPTPDKSESAGSHTPADKSVVIAGAGIIGLSTAWRLLNRGWDVTVLDANPVSGASYAAAGMLAPVSEVVWDQPTLYPLMLESGRMYADFAAQIAQDSGMDTGYVANGTYVCAGDSADRQALTDLLALQHELGMEIERVPASAARRAEPALGPGVVGAVDIPGDHQVDPRKLCAALLHVLGDRVIRDNSAQVHFDGGRAAGLAGESGTVYPAAEVVLATGMGIHQIAGLPPELEVPVRPVYGEVLRLNVPKRLQPLVTKTIRAVVHGYPVYVVPRPDGSVVLGATSREDELTGVSAEGVHQLLRDAHRVVPGILECEITEMTARARPGSPDDVPLIGTIAPGLTLSNGFFRHGILLAAIGSLITADIVTGEQSAHSDQTLAAVDPWRFSPGRTDGSHSGNTHPDGDAQPNSGSQANNSPGLIRPESKGEQ